jgi:DNA-binding response OmpR family regulator
MTRILIVEDDVVLRRFMQERLEKEGGFVVIAVGDGADALEALCHGGVDLILLDLIMPAAQIDGLGLLAHLSAHAELRKVPVAILSGLGAVVKEVLSPAIAQTLRICSVIEKPFDMSDLVGRVGEILSQPGRSLPPTR